MKKIIIGGTGRAGTTLLFQLFQACGLRTGQLKGAPNVFEFASAGLEETLTSSLELLKDDAAQIIKTPWAYQICEDKLFNSNTISYVIVPIRKQFAGSMSRTINETASLLDTGHIDMALAMINGYVPGGIWHSNDYLSQDSLSNQAYVTLSYWCAVKDIPFVALPFPDSYENPHEINKRLHAVFSEYNIDENIAMEWLAMNYNPQKLTVSPEIKETILQELHASLMNHLEVVNRSDGLMFIKALEKLIGSYKARIAKLEDELECLKSKHPSTAGLKRFVQYLIRR